MQTAAAVADPILSGENKEYSNYDNYDNVRTSNTSAKEKDPNKDNSTDDNNIKRKFEGKLFLIDNDPDIVYVLKHGLQKNGFLVDAFTNPEEALRSFVSNHHDLCLVVSDVPMPGLSGIQIARKVKQINPDIKVVLMTTFEIKDNEFSKVLPSTQVDGFVQKPISIADLTSKIRDLIGENRRSPGKD